MGKLSTDVSREVEALSHAFKVVVQSETYKPEHFGNAILTLAGPAVSFRIVRDRSEIFLDVRGAANDWVDVRGILGSLGLLENPRALHPLCELVEISVRNADVLSHRVGT